MKVLFLIKSEKTPSSRIRIGDLIPTLETCGIEPVVEVIPRSFRAKMKLFKKAADFPVTLLQKRLLNYLEFRALRRHSRRLIFDFDDAIYCKNSSPLPDSNCYKSATRHRLFKRTVANVDSVIVANRILGEEVLKFVPDVRVDIVPSSVDSGTVVPKTDYNLNTDAAVLGWIGTSSTLRYLEYIVPALRQVAAEEDIILRIIADASLELDGIVTDFIPWSLDSQYAEISGFDIGLMPLSEDPFSRGKAAYKLLQYMVSGVPAVCSPVGVNADISRGGEFALGSDTFEGFAGELLKLIRDKELRARLGRSGRELVEREYSTEVVGTKLAEVLLKSSGNSDSLTS